MKINYIVDEHTALEAGLAALRRYNQELFFPMDEQDIDADIVKEFFEAETNSEEEIESAKALAIAVAQAVYEHPDISKENKQDYAIRAAKEFVEALKGAKCDYNYALNNYGEGIEAQAKYEEDMNKNSVAFRATTLGEIKDKLKQFSAEVLRQQGIKKITGLVSSGLARLGLSASTSTAVASAGAVTISGVALAPLAVAAGIGALSFCAVNAAVSLIPKRVREKIKEKGHSLMQGCANVVSRAARHFESTRVGQVVMPVIREKVVPVIERGVNFVKEGWGMLKSTAKTLWSGIKSFFS